MLSRLKRAVLEMSGLKGAVLVMIRREGKHARLEMRRLKRVVLLMIRPKGAVLG